MSDTWDEKAENKEEPDEKGESGVFPPDTSLSGLTSELEPDPRVVGSVSSCKEEASTSKSSSSCQRGSAGKQVVLLNPIALQNFFKPAAKPSNSTSSANMEGGIADGESSAKNESSRSSMQSQEFLKLTQALATALKSEPKKKVFCANTNCNMKTDTVFGAPSFACLYFGMTGSGSPKICQACLKKAESYHEKSKSIIVNKENLFDLKFEIQTASSDSMVDLDSPANSPADSSSEKESTDTQTDIYSISLTKMNEALNDIMLKFDLKSQVDKCSESLTKEVHDLDADFMNMDLSMEKLRATLDSTVQLYNTKIAIKPQMVEIGTVDIDSRHAITVQRADNLGSIAAGLSRLGAKALSKAIADLKSLAGTGASPEVQAGTGSTVGSSSHQMHSHGRQLIFVKPKEGQEVYAMHKHSLCYWLPAKIIKVVTSSLPNRPTMFTVQFQQKIKTRVRSGDDKDAYIKEVSGKQLAFKKPSTVTLPIGCRIIARFKDLLNTDAEVDGMLYAGIIAELPKHLNSFRYLVFFDDGYAQYVHRPEVFPVVEASPDVWLDVHKNSQDFVQDYVTKYPDRHMIRAQNGSVFHVELNGQWLPAKIVGIDGSLMKVQYLRNTDVEFEWIYRGSTRLGPLFNRICSIQAKTSKPAYARRHTCVQSNNYSFEVNNDEDDGNKVARKHTGGGEGPGRVGSSKHILKTKNGVIVSTALESEGHMIKIQIPHNCPTPRPFAKHICIPSCGFRYDEEKFRKVSPLVIPFYLGWARILSGAQVFYHTPCGVLFKTYEQIHAYITHTKTEIPIDFFSLEPNIDALNGFEPGRKIESLKDISYGKEWTPVPCVNSLDHDLPAYMEYTTKRVRGKDVIINDDDGFLTCCDCEDDCRDKDKCACVQLTRSGMSFKIAKKEGVNLDTYENRRLKNHVLSGVYECNRKCKCRKTCFNRVVQNNVKWPIQIFKTVAKGWGVRALHDMPQGSFICVYTGQVLTDETANQEGRACGDEYLAELDYIECNEQVKEEYESDVTDIESEEPYSKSNSRMEKAKANSTNSGETKKTDVARKSTVHKAVKSTSGTKRTIVYLDDSQPVSPVNHPVARKSGSRNGTPAVESKQAIPLSPKSGVSSPTSTVSKRSSKEDSDSDEDDGGNVRAYSSFSASAAGKEAKNAARLETREYFGKNEAVYIMDAKSMGNFGRYLNHSCDPNVFVQNLFVDTHDIRFPWVAFFTKKDVKAGTELTWDYHYEIGSVPSKTLYCYCLQDGCRGRLL